MEMSHFMLPKRPLPPPAATSTSIGRTLPSRWVFSTIWSHQPSVRYLVKARAGGTKAGCCQCASRPVHPPLRGNSGLACWDSWTLDEGAFNHDKICVAITTSFSPTLFCRTPKECMWNVYHQGSRQY